MKLFLALVCFSFSAIAFGSAPDFKVTVPSNWKKTQTSFPGTLYVNSNSKNKQVVLIYTKDVGNSDGMTPEKIVELSAPISKIREDRLESIGLEEYSTLQAEVVNFANAPRVQGLQVEAQYVGYSDEMVQMIERQYFANGRIFSVVYTEESEQILDRAMVDRIMNQFTPVVQMGRAPASNEVVRRKSPAARYETPREKRKRLKREKELRDRKKQKAMLGLRPPTRPNDLLPATPEVPAPAPSTAIDPVKEREKAKREWIETCKALGVKDGDIRDFEGDDSAAHVPGCIKGLVLAIPKLLSNIWDGLTIENIKSGFSSIGSAASTAYSSVKSYFSDPTFKAQVNTSFLSAIETAKNTTTGELATRVSTNLSTFFKAQFQDFKCRSNLAQGEQVCAFAEKMLLGGVAFKFALPMLLRGAELTGEAMAAVLKTAAEARKAATVARASAASSAEGGAAAANAGAAAAEGAAGSGGASAGRFSESVRNAKEKAETFARKTAATARDKTAAAGEAVRGAATKARDAVNRAGEKLDEIKQRKVNQQREAQEAARKKKEAEDSAREKQAQAEAARQRYEAQEAARKQREAQEAARKQQEAQDAAARAQREAEDAVAAALKASRGGSAPTSALQKRLEAVTNGYDEAFIDRAGKDLRFVQERSGQMNTSEFMTNFYRPEVKKYMDLMNQKDQLTPSDIKRAETYLKALNVMKDTFKFYEKSMRNAAE